MKEVCGKRYWNRSMEVGEACGTKGLVCQNPYGGGI